MKIIGIVSFRKKPLKLQGIESDNCHNSCIIEGKIYTIGCNNESRNDITRAGFR